MLEVLKEWVETFVVFGSSKLLLLPHDGLEQLQILGLPILVFLRVRFGLGKLFKSYREIHYF